MQLNKQEDKTQSKRSSKKVTSKPDIADIYKNTVSNIKTIDRFTPTKRHYIIVAATLLTLSIVYASVQLSGSGNTEVLGEGTGNSSGQSEVIEVGVQPLFRLLLPSDKSETDVGGFARVSPPESAPVYAFTDNRNGLEIQVSQQEIPENFQPDEEASLKNLAESFAATELISSTDFRAYVGRSADGPQSVLMIKNDLLVLIKTSFPAQTEFWREYLESLQF